MKEHHPVDDLNCSIQTHTLLRETRGSFHHLLTSHSLPHIRDFWVHGTHVFAAFPRVANSFTIARYWNEIQLPTFPLRYRCHFLPRVAPSNQLIGIDYFQMMLRTVLSL